MIKIINPENAARVPFQLDGRIMLSRPEVEIIKLTLKPGEVIPPHVNNFDVAIYILAGQGILRTGQDSAEVKQGILAGIGAGEERGMENTGENEFVALIIKIFDTTGQSALK